MPEFTSNGVSYFWRDHGAGAQSAHFIHCSLASSRVWQPMMAEFAGELTSTAIDMPGHGRTGMPVPELDLQVQAAAASIKLIERAGGPVDLIGHSYGATVALRIAVERPDLLRSLVLIEPVFFAVLEDDGNPAFDAFLQLEHSFGQYLEVGNNLAAAQAFIKIWGGKDEWQTLPDAQRQKIADRIWFISRQADSIINRNDHRLTLQDMGRVTTPCLLIRGSESPPVVAQINQTLGRAIKGSKQQVVAGAGHMVPLTHQGQVAALLRAFWGEGAFHETQVPGVKH